MPPSQWITTPRTSRGDASFYISNLDNLTPPPYRLDVGLRPLMTPSVHVKPPAGSILLYCGSLVAPALLGRLLDYHHDQWLRDKIDFRFGELDQLDSVLATTFVQVRIRHHLTHNGTRHQAADPISQLKNLELARRRPKMIFQFWAPLLVPPKKDEPRAGICTITKSWTIEKKYGQLECTLFRLGRSLHKIKAGPEHTLLTSRRRTGSSTGAI